MVRTSNHSFSRSLLPMMLLSFVPIPSFITIHCMSKDPLANILLFPSYGVTFFINAIFNILVATNDRAYNSTLMLRNTRGMEFYKFIWYSWSLMADVWELTTIWSLNFLELLTKLEDLFHIFYTKGFVEVLGDIQHLLWTNLVLRLWTNTGVDGCHLISLSNYYKMAFTK